MIELPESIVLARQMNRELKGRRIESAIRGNTPHKFAFYNHTPEEYAAILNGKTVGEAVDHGTHILVSIEPDYVLALGGGGERIVLHQDEKTIPKKHQFLMHFEDGAYLSVTVQMWGGFNLLCQSELARNTHVGPQRISPLSDAFTLDYFQGLFAELEPDDPRAIKFFIISKPGVWGVGNGYLQDILFRARIHPRRKAVDVGKREQRALYKAVRETLKQAVDLGGRDTEHDLHDCPGHYMKLLDSRNVGLPCPECGTPIQKQSFLGGANYICPKCQV
jgi:formamidopyrimidine-DNA glycosylase